MPEANADLSTLDGPSRVTDGDVSHPARNVPALTILGHPVIGRIGERAIVPALASGGAIRVSRLEPHFSKPRSNQEAALSDPHLSRSALRIVRLGDGRLRFDKRDTPAKVVLNGQTLEDDRDLPGAVLEGGVVIELADRVVLLLHEALPRLDDGDDLGILGDSKEIAQVREEIRRIAPLDVTVLIVGTTGSGKELVARAIHRAGPRRARPFIAVNMGAIPSTLAGAELFGAERGAFTGSVRTQTGHFRAAGDGTLFLDEIGETPSDVQAMLLRALDTGEVIALGTSEAKPIRARLIAATDADLAARVHDGTFRAPLLHRLASYTLAVPPLRARRDDIGRLIVHFATVELERIGQKDRLENAGGHESPFLPASLIATLARFDWPGNVRQLRNVVRQLVVASHTAGPLIAPHGVERLLGIESLTSVAPASENMPSSKRERRKPSEVTEEELLESLRSCRWDLKATAEKLRISRTSLYALVEASPKVRRVTDIEPGDLVRCHQECEGDIDQMVTRLEVSKHALQRRLRELGLG